ncbi:MAG: ABC transporter substrate-binding protein [Butyricicoccus pullicaecorum]|nr:ABC transporter substrate-binding protein [Butyricicoccus pullicaecorum]MDO4669630.1 ABC transporter substrate-binding protein [Butyricicoccus pullicaecorum]
MKLKRMLSAGLALCLLVLSGCGAPKETPTADGLKPIEVVLDWYPNAIHAFLYNAIEKGYYAEEGLEVKLRFPSNENDALSLVAAGKADIGIYYPQYIIQARADQNVPVKGIGAIVQYPLGVVTSLAEKNIKSPADLVGKNIGYGGSELSEAIIRTMMKNVGADSTDITLTNVGFDLMSAMTTGNVDATVGCMVNHEIPQLIEEGFDINYFSMSDYGVPKDYEMVFLANDKTIEQDTETLKAFLRASQKGFADMKNDPQGSLDLLLRKQSADEFPLSRTVEEQSMNVLLPAMETDEAPFLSQREEVWQTDIDWLLENKLIDNPVAVSDVMVDLGVAAQ